jgi:hypothetical protein
MRGRGSGRRAFGRGLRLLRDSKRDDERDGACDDDA